MEEFLYCIVILAIVQFCKCQSFNEMHDLFHGADFPFRYFHDKRVLPDFEDYYPITLSNKNQLILLSSKENYELNNQFKNLAKSVGYIYNIKEINGNTVKDTIKATQMHKNVINLQTTDFYNYNYKDIEEKGLYYAGDIDTKTVKREVCVINTYNNTGDIVTDCFTKYQENPCVKLTSKAITESNILDGLVANFPGNKAIVLICYDGDKKEYIESYNSLHLGEFIELEHRTCNIEIEEINSNLLAVFTPKPLANDLIPLSVPRYFYGSSIVFNTDEDKYRNCLNVVPKWQPLPLAFLEFMNTVQWIRVAVISDHAQSSQLFETHLIQLFDKHKIIYTVEHCMNKDCDFKEELKSLKEASARIIIVNIENQKHAENFLISAQVLGMAESSNTVWIIREWPFRNYNIPLRISFTISLGVPMSESDPIYQNELQEKYSNVPELQSIFLYVQKIADEFRAKTSMYLDYMTDREKLYRNLAQNLRSKDSNAAFEAHVKKPELGEMKNILSMKVYRNGQVDSLLFKDPFPYGAPADSPKCALSKGRAQFYKPCNDIELVLIMIVSSALFLGVCLFIVSSDIYIEYLRKVNVSRERLVAH